MNFRRSLVRKQSQLYNFSKNDDKVIKTEKLEIFVEALKTEIFSGNYEFNDNAEILPGNLFDFQEPVDELKVVKPKRTRPAP